MLIQTLNYNNETPVELTELAPTNKKSSIIRVLHVDDDPCLLEVSKQILSMDNQFEIEVATSVEAGFKKLATGNYLLALSTLT